MKEIFDVRQFVVFFKPVEILQTVDCFSRPTSLSPTRWQGQVVAHSASASSLPYEGAQDGPENTEILLAHSLVARVLSAALVGLQGC